MLVREMRVPHRDLNVLVAHETADGEDINASHDEARREGVAQIVPVEVLDGGGLQRGESPVPVLIVVVRRADQLGVLRQRSA